MVNEEKRSHGSFNELGELVEKENIRVATVEMVMVTPMLISTLVQKQRHVFSSYYLKQMSIDEIVSEYGLKRYDVEMALKSATAMYLESLRKRYGIK